MPLRLCVLASGSSGNCIYIGTPTRHVLVDAGLSGRETARRLAVLGLSLEQISAVCVTHEHDDHRASLPVLHRRSGVALYANSGTVQAIQAGLRDQTAIQWNVFATGSPFDVGDLRFEPFSVPHDSYDPVGFVVGYGASRIGIVTDIGTPTALVRQRLRDCDVLVLESNHDEQLLKDADRPWSLKQRIMGRQGHLSNAQAAELISEVAGPRLKVVYLAHLSSDCNRPHLAERCMGAMLEKHGFSHVAVKLTFPDRISEVTRIDGDRVECVEMEAGA
jgi:phosphoribosyl 1,2-cyclic phosphodiesterase